MPSMLNALFDKAASAWAVWTDLSLPLMDTCCTPFAILTLLTVEGLSPKAKPVITKS